MTARNEPPAAPAADTRVITIDSIAAGGDGVGRVGELVAFVPRTAPGDVAEVELTTGGRFARGTVRRLVLPSSERVDPPCPHYVDDRCGGCQLQHLSYDGQLAAKRTIVSDALARIARRPSPVASVRPSPTPWRYRRKLTLALRRRGDGWVAGLHPYDRPGAVFRLADCPITDERVVSVWRDVMRATEHLPREAHALRGAVRIVEGEATFTLEGGRRWPGARAFFAALPTLRELWWAAERRSPRLVQRRGHDHAAGASFVQVNPQVADGVRDRVVELALSHAPATAVDAYAGMGHTAGRLAHAGVAVTAIELDPYAAEQARAHLPRSAKVVAARVEDALVAALPADVVILNPPRGGVDERVTRTLEGAAHGAHGPPPKGLLYVSCNPATLARDLARLPSFAVASVEPWDMFPQTAHVETVCALVPAASPRQRSEA